MCLSEFVLEYCVYYGCVPWEIWSPPDASKRVFPCKVSLPRRHGHANATVARHHRHRRHANATAPGHGWRRVNATRLHHRRHPRRHNPDGLGAPTGDAADVVAAPAPQGISSELEALAALHQKGALTDGEFAAAKAKLLG